MSEGSTVEFPVPFSRGMQPEAKRFGRPPMTAADKADTFIGRIMAKPMTRRAVVGGGAVAATALVVGSEITASRSVTKGLLNFFKRRSGEPAAGSSIDIAAPPPGSNAPLTPGGPSHVETEKTPEPPSYLEQLQDILNVAPFEKDGETPNKTRTDMETVYTDKLVNVIDPINDPKSIEVQDPENVHYTTPTEELLNTHQENVLLDQIDKGLAVIVDKVERANLMSLRFKLRQDGHLDKLGVFPLSQDKYQWARDNDISPEMLAICLDNETRTKGILKKLLVAGKLRDELKDLSPEVLDQIDPEQFMINAGGLAELFMQETHGFVNIGGAQALSQLQGDYYGERTTALPQLCELVNNEPGIDLRYTTENISGSAKGGDENASGGAIGPQFMPGNAVEYLTLIHDVTGEWLNPFDPSDAAVMSWVFLARQEWVGPGPNDYRVGYKKGDDLAILNALKKWNNLPSEYNAIYKDAIDYYYKFLSSPQASIENTEKPRQIARIAQSDKRFGDLLARAA